MFIKYLINKSTNILNVLTHKSHLTVRIIILSNELLETLEMIENCASCRDKIGYHLNKFNKSINKIKDLLDRLEKEQEEGEKEHIINNLSDKLIYMDSTLNTWALCKSCKGKNTINKLTHISNKLINKSYLTVEITHKLVESLETLEMMENCPSCKDKIAKYDFNEFNKSINEIGYLLDELEKEEQKRGEKGNMIDNLSDKLIYIDKELNESMLCEGCKRKKSDKLMDKLTNTLNKLTNKSYLTVEITH